MLTKRHFWHSLLIIMIALTPSTLLADITLAGSSTILPVVQEAAKAFYAQTGIRINAKGGGSGAGLQAAQDGSAAIGMVSRGLDETEGQGLEKHLIGYDGIAIILHSSHAISAITKDQARDIYSGKITNWRTICKMDGAIKPIAKHMGRSTRKLFDSYLGLQNLAPTAHMGGPNAEVIVLVGTDPGAIGYVSIGSAELAQEAGVQIKLLSLDGVAANRENIINGTYPIRRELNLVTRGKPDTEARQFIAYLKSEAGRSLINKHHFITPSE